MSEVEAGLATRQIFLVKDAGRGVFKNGSAEQILARGAGYYDDVKLYKELEYIEIGLTSEWFSDTDNEEDYEITNEISRQMKIFNL